ncbi:MAG: Gfo/Idh/MocA family protein [Planctomyces sp.]
MSGPGRRSVLKAAASLSFAVAVGGTARAASAPAEKITLGFIGPGGMGMSHLRELCRRSDISIAAICDVDEVRLQEASDYITRNSPHRPRTEKDMRKLLDDPALDAVFIATPDHWHAPAAILSLNAGKHVYVEKPCCHNIREGRLMADAVAKSGRLLQVGTQSRSTEFIREGIQRLHEGEIGEIITAKAWNSQRRGNIGHTTPSDPPATLDYDIWTGPAPMVPYRSNLLPSKWRWWYNFGCGDIGNDGVHDIDVAVWGMNEKTHPERVTCLGGKYFFDDDQEFPDTQCSISEYAVAGSQKKRQLIFEQRDWSPYVQEGYENGSAWYGTKGVMIMGHVSGWKMFREKNQLVAEGSGAPDLAAHHTNFLDCIRGTQKTLNADINAGLLGAGVVHLSNISARMKSTLEFDTAAERITNHEQADGLIARQYRDGHWAVPAGVARS